MNNKQIIVIGVFTPESTNIGICKGFLKYGYSVIPVSYRTIIRDLGHQKFNEGVLKLAKQEPNLIFIAKGNGINPNLIEESNLYTQTMLWNMDPIQTIMQTNVISLAKAATFSSCTGLGVVKYFHDMGATKTIHIVEGFDHEIFKPVQPNSKYSAEVSFIGTETPLRREYYEFLKANNVDVKFYGPGFGPEARNKEFSQVCCSSKFVLSINTFTDIPEYFSNRLQMCLATGTCTLHFDPTNSLDKYFTDKKEILYFRTKEELLNLIRTTSDEDRIRIGRIGRDKAVSMYSWDVVVERIIEHVQSNKIQ